MITTLEDFKAYNLAMELFWKGYHWKTVCKGYWLNCGKFIWGSWEISF